MANLSSFSSVVDNEAVIPGVGGHAGKYLSTDGSTMSWSTIVQGVTTYATAGDLPLTGVDEGTMAYVSGNTRVYFWNGSGWYSLALVNTAPTITTGADDAYALALDGTATVITLEASDPEGVPLTWSYSVTSGSIGNTATVSQSANVFTITPSTNEAYAGEFSLTFTASDGINTATDTAAFTLAFVTIVENSAYTTALITGAAASQNQSITDSSSNAHTVTVSGQTSAQTFSPYRSGGYSYSSDGSGQMYAQGLDVGTGTFTVECWYYYSVAENNSSLRQIFQVDYGYSTAGFGFRRRSGYIYATKGNTTLGSVVEADYVNQWIHLAVVCNSNDQATFYINGTAVTTNESISFTGGGSNRQDLDISILSTVDGVTWNNDFYCPEGDYVRDFRIVKSAVYTSSFTPPEDRLEAITNTEFLTCHLPYVKDGSTNDHSITLVGGITAQPFGQDHFEYDSATHGGSIFFDGGYDYHDQQINAIGTSDFTLEFWAYHTVDQSGEDGIFNLGSAYGAGGAQTAGLFFAMFSNAYCAMAGSAANTDVVNTYSSGDIPIGSWYHIAICRSSGTTTLYYNGTAIRTASDSVNYTNTYLRIGSYYSTNYGLQGYVSDFRIVRGTAVYTSDFTPPTEPLTAISGTELLISGTDAGIVDKSQSQQLTITGNATGSTTQTKYGTSMYIDYGAYVTLPDSEFLDMGTDDFTVEFWYRHGNTYGSYPSIISGKTWTGGGVGIRYDNTGYSNKFGFFWRDVGDPWLVTPGTFSETDWHHVALTRSGNNFTLWVNGVSQATGTNSGSIDWAFGGDCKVGWAEWDGSEGRLNAYIEDLRITKGLARYTSSFTPPTASLEG
jgi:hypothetical protein